MNVKYMVKLVNRLQEKIESINVHSNGIMTQLKLSDVKVYLDEIETVARALFEP